MAVQEFISPTSLGRAQQAVGDGARRQLMAWPAVPIFWSASAFGSEARRSPDPSLESLISKQIPELTAIEVGETALVRIGAAASAFDVLHNSDVPSLFPGLAEALNLIGSTQITGQPLGGWEPRATRRQRQTVFQALIANGAQCRILGPDGERTLAVEDFVVGPNQNALAPGELLVELILPRPAAGTSMPTCGHSLPAPRWILQFKKRGAGDVSITLDNESGTCTAARVAIGAVAPTALLVETAGDALVGSQLERPR